MFIRFSLVDQSIYQYHRDSCQECKYMYLSMNQNAWFLLPIPSNHMLLIHITLRYSPYSSRTVGSEGLSQGQVSFGSRQKCTNRQLIIHCPIFWKVSFKIKSTPRYRLSTIPTCLLQTHQTHQLDGPSDILYEPILPLPEG